MILVISQATALQGAAHLAACARRLARREVQQGRYEAHLARATFYDFIAAVLCPALGFTALSRQATLPGVGHPQVPTVVAGYVHEPKVIIHPSSALDVQERGSL